MSHQEIDTPKELNSKFGKVLFIALIFFSFYVLGDIFPDYWWSTHSSHFISNGAKYLIFALSLAFIFISRFQSLVQDFLSSIAKPKSYNHHAVIWSFSLLMGFLFYSFPMVADFYGEAYILNPQIFETVSKVSVEARNDLFSFGLNPWAGQKTIFAIITYLAYFSGENYHTVFIYFDAFFGFCFVLTWLYFIHEQLSNLNWKIILTLAVCTAPFMLNYFGHLEINAPILWISLLWLTTLVRYFKNKKAKQLWFLLFLLVCYLKLHAISILLIPIWVILCISHFKSQFVISWKKTFYYIFIPVFTIGIICYFFVFEDYKDPRNLDFTVSEYDRLFLPIISPEAPLDKYNLFSINHIFDYFSELLLWSPIALFLMVSILVFFRKRLNWNDEDLVLVTTTLILFSSLFFVVNPLLSMQMDWDLFSFPAPILLVFLVLLVKQIENEKLDIRVLPISIAIALLNIPFFTVHFSEDSLSRKLESLGIRIYHTYYEWSSQTIHNGLSLLSNDRNLQIDRKNKLLYKLADSAIEGNDREYGLLWRKDGAFFLDVHKDVSKAYVYLEKALLYYPQDNYTKLLLLECYLLLDSPEQAYELALELRKANYPNQQNASVTLVQCALMAEKYADAQQHSQEHLKAFPNDKNMQVINQRLRNNIDIAQLKNMFFNPKKN